MAIRETLSDLVQTAYVISKATPTSTLETPHDGMAMITSISMILDMLDSHKTEAVAVHMLILQNEYPELAREILNQVAPELKDTLSELADAVYNTSCKLHILGQ